MKGAAKQLEAAARRQRLDWLRDALADSGLPRPIQWLIEKRIKKGDFTEEELAVEIEAARGRCAHPGVVEVKVVA